MNFSIEQSQDEWRRSWQRDPPVGEIATTVIFENDEVRVWDLRLEPGETSPLHTHMHPYLFVVLEPARCRAAFADGTVSEDHDPAGAVVWAGLEPDRRTHTLENIDDHRYVNRVVELKSVT